MISDNSTLGFVVLFFLPCLTLGAANFKAERATDHGIEIVRLTDAAAGVEVSIVPSIGNRAFRLSVHGKNLLYFPFADAAAFKSDGAQGLNGVPFLAPWANRIPGGGFWANGKRYTFNGQLGTVHLDPNGIAIHGMLTTYPLWKVTGAGSDRESAHVISRLQFWKDPDLMANWPFAHEYEMTYTLTHAGLQVTTTVTNLSAQPMPVVLGFHPYFDLPDVPRSEWLAHIAARKHVETDPTLVPTGELTSVALDDQISLASRNFDDGFTDLIRGSDGRATFSVQAGTRKIEVIYGPKYQVAVVFAPPGRKFICFEPMTAITNGINLAHEGKYSSLQTVASGSTWTESFLIQFSGF